MMLSRDSCKRNGQQAAQAPVVEWATIPYEAADEPQRQAWTWLWDRLLRPTSLLHRPQVDGPGAAQSISTIDPVPSE
jgi:hypothetical protein